VPSPTKAGTTRMLLQILSDVHAGADARRRKEGMTWDRVITELLRRWGAGGSDEALSAPVRVRAARPSPERDTEHRRATLAQPRAEAKRVDPTSIKWHRSLSGLLAAEAQRSGKSVPAGALDGLIDDDQEAAP